MYLPPGPLDGVLDQLIATPRDSGDGFVLFIGERDHPDLEALVSGLGQADVPFVGGVFPGVIRGTKRYECGIVAQRVPFLVPPFVAEGLDSADPDLPIAWLEHAGDPGPRTAVVLVDGLAANISGFLAGLFSYFGDSLHYFGGGAGSMDFAQRPCLIAPSGVHENAAVLALLPWQSRLGVSHGWQRLEGPLVATRTEGNVICELNWEPAFDVYRATIAPHIDRPLVPEHFFEISKGFPFGIPRDGAEDVVRDPVSVGPAGELRCVGEVPENTVLHILRGDRTSLVRAAERAARMLRASSPNLPQAALLADCVSRALFLEEAFDDELDAFSRELDEESLVVNGMLSLGEISSYGDGLLEFFNKTIVAGALGA